MGGSCSNLSPADCSSYAQSTEALEGEGVVCRGHEDHSVHVSRGSLNKRVPCHTGSHPTLEVSEVLQSWAGVGDLAGLLASPVTDPEVTPELTVEVEEFWWTSANKYYIYQEDLYCRYRCIDSDENIDSSNIFCVRPRQYFIVVLDYDSYLPPPC